jgi:hypothetical protein
MKQIVLISSLLFLIGCAQDRIAKPDKLMPEEQMIEFHIDLALLNASSSDAKNHFAPIDSLYAFYGIDSTTFAQSNSYYASKPKLYIKIFESVKVKLEAIQVQDTISKSEKPKQ